MRSIDLSPLYRSSIGFDRMASLLDAMMANEAATPSYPPYNIEKTSDDTYRISVAVAGFSEADISVESRESELVITGAKQDKDGPNDDGPRVLYRGIAERSFERRFKLADHVRVNAARLENGLLHVDLRREIPEALKPRKIEISAGPQITQKP